MANRKITFDLTFEYLQEIRMAQAVMEAGFTIGLPAEFEIRFRTLKEYFPTDYAVIEKKEEYTLVKDVLISHKTVVPETRIGQLSRPLILPHSMFDYCRGLWAKERKVKYAFIGKLTKSRKIWMDQFLSKKLKGYWRFTGKVAIDARINQFIGKVFGSKDPFLMTASLRGRQFPGKSWDDDYFRLQSQSQFIICPSGDVGCPWTYRFFEAMICGAIPIVETSSPCYAPFKFYMASDDPKTFVYDPKIVEFNFEQCIKHLTVPNEELKFEINRLIG